MVGVAEAGRIVVVTVAAPALMAAGASRRRRHRSADVRSLRQTGQKAAPRSAGLTALEARRIVDHARDVPIAGAAARELVATLCETIEGLARIIDTKPIDGG